MRMRIKGVTVTVSTPNEAGTDRYGEPIYGTPTQATVDNVLVDPVGTSDLEAARVEGDRVDLTLHFPKTWTASLRGCTVTLPAPWAGTYRVVGDPKPYMDANTPTPWHMPVGVVAVDG